MENPIPISIGPNHEIREAVVSCFDLDIYGIKSEFEIESLSDFDIRYSDFHDPVFPV